ncbi:Crp/Fnr family transcriptional regulator [Arachidicoccus terrestris]|uniref:Crp/Fnr family transcriptional regulator n=1 Tax=Arachidicoccus terrestris TaxID=2875539 RepID=UPI001CC7940B|nr:Crp/Fnr family transcriptional regulator [Arachidicoccus terrestris]UAY56127.1 Crp/Fnr family transcriptional regulator [Arachidicoccus terrestris]
MYPLLRDNIQGHITLSEDQLEKLEGLFQEKMLKKKHYLLQEGDINQGLAFVTEGLLRSYKVDSNGFEHVLQFAPPGWWMADMKSLNRQEPADLFIEALEPTYYLFISRAKLDEAFEAFPELERHFRILAENAVIAYQQRLIGNLSQPAIERFATFCHLYPTLTQSLPHKQIASFIGVTPEFFSKMINNMPLPD